MRRLTAATLRDATHHLARIDPALGEIVHRLGVPPMWGRAPGFPTLIRIILEQQVSLASARTLYERLERQLGVVTPDTVFALGVDGLRDFGLTRQKAAYCFALAERVLEGDLDLAAVSRAPDDIGRRRLLDVPGLGPWSVDIYYLMALRRPNVWPQGDLALAAVLREIRHLDTSPTRDEQLLLAGPWAPWRSVAARILWSQYLAARGQYPAPPTVRSS